MSGVGVFIFSVLLFSAGAIPAPIDEIIDGEANQYPFDSIDEHGLKESRSADDDDDDESSPNLLSVVFDLASKLLGGDSDSDDTPALALRAAPYPGGYYGGSYGGSYGQYGYYPPPPPTKPPRQRPNLIHSIFTPPPHVVHSLVYPTRRPPSYIQQNLYNRKTRPPYYY